MLEKFKLEQASFLEKFVGIEKVREDMEENLSELAKSYKESTSEIILQFQKTISHKEIEMQSLIDRVEQLDQDVVNSMAHCDSKISDLRQEYSIHFEEILHKISLSNKLYEVR